MRHSILTHSALLLSFLTSTLSAPTAAPQISLDVRNNSPQVIDPKVDAYIQDLMKRYSVPGSTVVVVSEKGEEVKTYGVMDVDGTANTPETCFPLASNSKLITSLAIGFMLESGVTLANGQKLALDSRMKDIIPGFEMMDKNGTDTATLLDFLSMRSGLPQHVLTQNPGDNPHTSLTQLPYLKSTLPVGQYQYSNENYVILSLLPEVLLNQTLADYVRSKLFDPLGLSAGAGYNATAAKEAGPRTQGFYRGLVNITECTTAVLAGKANVTDEVCSGKPTAFEFWTAKGSDGSELAGGGSLIMNGDDMLKYLRDLIHPNVIPQSVLTRAQTAVNTYLPPTNSTNPVASGSYQLGVVTQNYRNHTTFLHDGALPGSLSLLTRIPERNIGVFVVANDDLYGSYFTSIVTNTIIDSILGLEPIDWEKKTLSATTEGGSTSTSGSSSGSSTIPTSNSTKTITPPPTGYLNRTFSDKGYGNFTLQSLDLANPASLVNVTFPVDYYALYLAPSQGISLGGTGTNSTPVLYWAEWGKSLLSHIVFSHYDGPYFNYTILSVRDRVYPNSTGNSTSNSNSNSNTTNIKPGPTSDVYTTKLYDIGTAVFAEGGIGLFGNILLSGVPIPKPVVEGVKDKAALFLPGM